MASLPPPHWWTQGLTEEGERWSAAHYDGQLPDSWEAAGLRPAKDSFDRVFLDDIGRIWILAGCDEWYSGIRPKPLIVGEQHTSYEIAMTLDDRHPYSALFSCGAGTGVEDDRREDLRRNAIALSDKSQKIYDTIITAHGDNRIKHAPTSWGKPADNTLLVFNVADAIEVILHELADDLAALGNGGVIGALRNQRDNAKAERERQTSSETPSHVTVGAAFSKDEDGSGIKPQAQQEPPARREVEKWQQTAFLQWANPKWPDGIPMTISVKRLVKEYFDDTGFTINESTVRRAQGRKK